MNQSADLVLYGYWRSGTSYRTRIALNFKRVAYRQESVNLLAKSHREAGYRALNPQGFVPALMSGDMVLTQSNAIIEWLEERYPDPPLLPSTPDDRAIVRAMAMTVACDIHPINNMRVLERLTHELGADEAARKAWMAHWNSEGFAALEAIVGRHGGTFAFGDHLTLADCCIVPQFYSAERFGVPLDDFPKLRRVVAAALTHPAVAAAHPDRQPDASSG